MYADDVTDSMSSAIGETNRRRYLQMDYNEQHGIDPQTIRKKVSDILELVSSGPSSSAAGTGAWARWRWHPRWNWPAKTWAA